MSKYIVIKKVDLIIILLSILLFSSVSAQIPPGMSPAMMSQFGNMNPNQMRDLAEQYGINLNQLGLGASNDMTPNSEGNDSQEMDSNVNEVLYKRIIDAQDYRNKAEERKRKNVPIFERDISSIENLPIFGKFLFDGEYSTFSRTDNFPIPSSYNLGVGDSVRVDFFGNIDPSINPKTNLTINRSGEINFPEIGVMNIAGMTFPEVKSYIESQVSSQMIGVRVNVSMGRLRTINVFMAGESKVPGAYSMSGLSTVSQALFVAGGVTEIGTLRNIQVKRSGKNVSSYDLYRLLTEGDSSGDIRLQSGDVVFIPPIKKIVYIDGAINRPGRYELKENESISNLISIAGGLKSRAYKKQLHIERYVNKNNIPSITNLDLTIEDNNEFLLRDGDIIRVPEIDDSLSNSVIIRGAVKRPGRYGWEQSIRFSEIMGSINLDFSNNFDMKKGLIIRRKNKSNFEIEVLDFNIINALNNPSTEHDPIIELYDEILIFSLGENDDKLNDLVFYIPDEDITHPSYGKSENDNSEDLSMPLQDPSLMDPYLRMGVDARDQMTYEDFKIELHEAEKEAEFYEINKGKRRVLLKPIIDKLSQQATSSNSLRVVSISGAVKVPGDYPLVEDATYQDLIDLAGGYSDEAFIEAAELRETLVTESGSMTINTTDVDLKIQSGSRLKSRDHLHIRSIKDWSATDSVELTGEVAYPGTYLISPNEKLSSVIRRAGGFTNESFIEGAIFTRESIKEKEREQLRILGDTIRRDQAARSMTKESEDFSVNSSEVEAGISALMSSEVYGRLIIDVLSLVNGNDSADIVLQDGDILNIPKFTNAVTVVGEVRRSGSFVLRENFSVKDYIELAAGMTARGDEDELYIIRANGSVEKGRQKKSLVSFSDGRDDILAGDTIVIPIKSSYQTPLNLYRTVSQVVFQSIASIAAFSTVFN